MNKFELIRSLAKKTDSSVIAATNFLVALQELFVEELSKGEDVRIPGFLSATVKDVPASTGRNPKTGALIKISARKRILIRVGKSLKDRVNEEK